MTWTYTNAPTTTTAAGRRDAVRLMTGDTDSTMIPTNSDEEIAFYLLQNGNALLSSAIDCLRSLLAKWAPIPTTEVVGVGKVWAGDVYKALQSTMAQLVADASKGAMPMFGGQSIAQNQAWDALTDVPQPTFKRNQDDYPGVSL
jgi:hypothetical protein